MSGYEGILRGSRVGLSKMWRSLRGVPTIRIVAFWMHKGDSQPPPVGRNPSKCTGRLRVWGLGFRVSPSGGKTAIRVQLTIISGVVVAPHLAKCKIILSDKDPALQVNGVLLLIGVTTVLKPFLLRKTHAFFI